MFLFDLKSAYLQVKINENFTKYFGFCIEGEDGSKRYFYYRNMPFGLNDACRVLTKLLRSPLERWRKQGIKCFLHVDDGLGLVKGRDAAVRASECVRRDLQRYGLLASEEKSEWGARRQLVWTGFVWDTVSFKLFIPEEKLVRVESLMKELLEKKSEAVKDDSKGGWYDWQLYTGHGQCSTVLYQRNAEPGSRGGQQEWLGESVYS